MYFTQFPQIFYEFEINGVVNIRPITDITHNVRFRKEVLSNISLYDWYDVKDGETPDILADRLYGSSLYHWAIMLFNERYNYITDWPMSTDVLEEYINDTYSNPNGIHHYEVNGLIVDINDFWAYETIPDQTYMITVLGDTNWDGLTGDVDGTYAVGTLITAKIPSNADDSTGRVRINSNTVTNHEYETALNDAKRRIKIVDAALLKQIIKDFKILI